MKRFIRFVTKLLYPQAWRNRYGSEFEALLEEVNGGWRPFFDVVRSGLEMQLRTWNAGKMLATMAVAGGVIGFGILRVVPKQYVSNAVIQIDFVSNQPSATDQAVGSRLNEVGRASLSRPKLAHLVETFGLYERERTKASLEDAVETMKKAITVKPADPRRDAKSAFIIQFAYSDPAMAQRVTQELVASVMDESNSSQVPMTLEVTSPANLPMNPVDPNRGLVLTAGLVMGLFLGLLVIVFRNSLRMRHS